MRKKINIKQGIFKKSSYVEIPDEFVAQCEIEDNKPIATQRANKNFILISNDADLLDKKKESCDVLFSNDNIVPITLHRGKHAIIYKDILGFFEFRGEIYYRAKGVAGRHLKSDMPFSAKIKELYPEDYKDALASEISNIEVTPLYLL